MKDTKKEHNSNNIIDWIFIFGFLLLAIATIFNYIDLKNPTIQVTVVFIAEIIIIVVFMLIMLLDSMQRELYDINNSLYDIAEKDNPDALASWECQQKCKLKCEMLMANSKN